MKRTKTGLKVREATSRQSVGRRANPRKYWSKDDTPVTTYNCTTLIGGLLRSLDTLSVEELNDGDRATVMLSDKVYQFLFDADGITAENISTHPYVVRPNDYKKQGIWKEQETEDQEVDATTNAANITANAIVIGDDGADGVKESDATISDNGEMVNTKQPCFQAYIAAQQANVTGDGTSYNLTGAIWTERFDQNADFSNGVFTAPVTGKYLLNFTLSLDQVPAGTYTTFNVAIVTSNRTYYTHLINGAYIPQAGGACIVSGTIIADMDATDTAYLNVAISGTTKTIDLQPTSTHFMGALLC